MLEWRWMSTRWSGCAVTLLGLSAATALGLDLLPADYDPHVRPRGPDSGPVTVYISMRINSINEVDERAMKVVIEVYFRHAWKDPRLVVPEHLFNGTDAISLAYGFLEDVDLWVPDPYIEKVHEIHTAAFIDPFGGIRLYKDGKLFFSQMFIITLGCPMFFHDFPFDKQTCHLELASYFYGNQDMAFDWEGDGITASSGIPDQLGNYEFSFFQENSTSCFTPGYVNGNYPCLRSSMTFKRRYRNYLLGVYVPSSLFVVVSWASFFWPADAIPARTVLLITALLTIISLYSGVQQMTPPANYTRAIDIWFFACILAVALALFQYAIILQLREMQKASGIRQVRPLAISLLAAARDKTATAGGDGSAPAGEKSREYWAQIESRLEQWSRTFYVAAFLVFNAVYWPLYL
ncbi:glutamate-gated chloride channel alpha-like [Penaeus chinensis]|uniref:glutamate-gated chloride channel alpha-like n=1 Tax=Penaeus chinensis TaxID=139456 RepID=UPI001FB5FFB8|nr:glutamate-gated chloride channel alpha-like [Penaeus chinensis]